MPMQYFSEADENGLRWVGCPRCDYRRHTHFRPEQVRHPCPAGPEPVGVGIHLHRMLIELGAKSDKTCQCLKRARQMDAWGPDGCRKRRKRICRWLQQSAYKTWLSSQAAMGWQLMQQPWFKLRRPIDSILEEAIHRAEEDLRRSTEAGSTRGEPGPSG